MRSSSRAAGIVLTLVVLAGLVVAADRLGLAGDQAGPVTTSQATRSTTASAPRATTAAPTRPTRGPTRDPDSGLPFVALDTLPREAQQTVTLIDRGGPFPYAKDGARFGNRQRLLPGRPSGYYREYTVETPGESDRGARRIVTGDQDRELFYTGDHYVSFARVRR